MNYKLKFHPDALKDLQELDHRVKLLVLKQINKGSSTLAVEFSRN